VGVARGWPTPPYCVGGLWPPSSSLSVFGTLLGKIRLLELVSSNSENISVTTQDFINFWGKFFVFVLLEMIGISQGFKTFESI
jgi:hypothetical protein